MAVSKCDMIILSLISVVRKPLIAFLAFARLKPSMPLNKLLLNNPEHSYLLATNSV